MDKSRRNYFSIITITFLVFCLFPTVAYAAKFKGKIRDFFKDISGVSFVQNIKTDIRDFNEALKTFSQWSDIFAKPIFLLGNATKLAREDQDELLYNLAKNSDRIFADDVTFQAGMCKYSNFKKSLVPSCMINAYNNASGGIAGPTDFDIGEIRIATDKHLLFTNLTLNMPVSSIESSTGSPVGIGVIITGADTLFRPRLLLYCPGCADYTPSYANSSIVMPPDTAINKCATGTCMYRNSSATVQIKNEIVLVKVSLEAMGLKPGDTFALAGIIETFSNNEQGFPYVVNMNTSPFVRVKIPE